MQKKCAYCGSLFDATLTECPHCGGRSSDHVCQNCGAEYDGAVCPKCGIRFDDAGRICPRCGARMFARTCATCGYTDDLAKAATSTVKKAGEAAASLFVVVIVGMIGVFAPYVSNLVFFLGRKYGKATRWATSLWSLFFAAAMFNAGPENVQADGPISQGGFYAMGVLTVVTLILGLFVVWRRSKKEKEARR